MFIVFLLLFQQLRTFLTTYNRLSESCFIDCVHDFTSRTVTNNEVRENDLVIRKLIWNDTQRTWIFSSQEPL